MSLLYTGTASIIGGNITIVPDGVSTSITIDITKFPLSVSFPVGGIIPSSAGPTSKFSVVIPTNPPQTITYTYDASFSYTPSTSELVISFSRDISSSSAPAIIPANAFPFVVPFTLYYTSL